jgi:hypothetical protein
MEIQGKKDASIGTTIEEFNLFQWGDKGELEWGRKKRVRTSRRGEDVGLSGRLGGKHAAFLKFSDCRCCYPCNV